ncbi:MHYT domain-containing protein [Antribacter gilvus]|uniref:MHYT domain-containing protein n=1 Tax=Antribacter gilvus TaxID=2304675 RepID=UPI000F782EE4|nr:MHYT domain-containing protein [Antribacter gilvus]
MIDHFSQGLLTPALSFALSCIGCAAGLSATARARVSAGRQRSVWLILGAIAIGGTGIWVMHFVAMLGFAITGAEITYDIPLTLASAVLAVVVVGVGLFIVDRGRSRTPHVLAGGAVAGLGVTGMHYLGMAAMHAEVAIEYDPLLVALSVVIALVAASVGLWLAVNVRGVLAAAASTVVMGIAVSGMHYTGMSAMSAHHEAGTPIPVPTVGVAADELLLPLIAALTVSTLLLVVVVTIWPSAGEMRTQAQFEEWKARQQEIQRVALEQRSKQAGPFDFRTRSSDSFERRD